MIVSILQPGYLPWLGFFEQLHRCDTFVIYDDVQYDKNGWRNRNRIKTPNGIQWLTVPVKFNLSERLPNNKIKVDNGSDWRKKHLLAVKYNYSRARFYKDYIPLFEDAYSKQWEYLIDVDMFFILKLSERLGINKEKIRFSSDLNVKGDRIERLINLCKIFNADTFYEGFAGRDYINEEDFMKEGIKVEYQDYKHPVYDQLYGGFESHLSVIDLLLNHGKDSLAILAGKNT